MSTRGRPKNTLEASRLPVWNREKVIQAPPLEQGEVVTFTCGGVEWIVFLTTDGWKRSLLEHGPKGDPDRRRNQIL